MPFYGLIAHFLLTIYNILLCGYIPSIFIYSPTERRMSFVPGIFFVGKFLFTDSTLEIVLILLAGVGEGRKERGVNAVFSLGSKEKDGSIKRHEEIRERM